MSYNAKVYRKQGGNELVAGNGGTITVESGGTLDVQAGATLNLPSGMTPTDLSLAEGNILIGDSNGYAAALSAKTTGRILVGNGTTIASVAFSGDAALAANGAVTVSKIGGDASSGRIPIGNGSAMVNVAVSGDLSLAGNGNATIGNGAITTVKVGAGAVTGVKMAATGLKAASFLGANAAGSITLTGAVAGDRVLALFRSDNAGAIAAAANFETTISANDAIQQLTNSALGGFVYSVILIPAAA